MAFPKTLNEMKTMGYRFERHGRCRDCGHGVEWWQTPTQKWVRMNIMAHGESEAIAHGTTCCSVPSAIAG